VIDRTGEIRSTRAPTLREDQIEILRRYGQTRKTQVGDILFRAGDTSNDFIVILQGEVQVVDDFAGEARTIGTFLAGRFLGELNMLTGQAMYLTAVVSEAGEVLAVPRERLKEVVTEEPNLSDVILKAFLARRTYMIRTALERSRPATGCPTSGSSSRRTPRPKSCSAGSVRSPRRRR
jgi:thioredoxin reductase (NADPH)